MVNEMDVSRALERNNVRASTGRGYSPPTEVPCLVTKEAAWLLAISKQTPRHPAMPRRLYTNIATEWTRRP